MKRFCFALDLRDDPALIAEYEFWHRNVWPGIPKTITDAGITNMEIYRILNRLFMIMDTTDDYDPAAKAAADAANPLVQQWEAHTWKYQQALPHAMPGEKWMPMEKIFQL
ncbi:L-rhamnose mutarotase [Chryseolinea lacunae]|uniref:L-rhamnose mutarotase n=1 Tax=Chryseolinea lacunae TaxID=2801331 RepID=A0ABS1KYG4_9BACT|nr:L-rhamnose mutarotase [Chryseolinea lacunae]MBL0744491.1 L-rhamnose mutarotase [Chryseolinea lacunae]